MLIEVASQINKGKTYPTIYNKQTLGLTLLMEPNFPYRVSHNFHY